MAICTGVGGIWIGSNKMEIQCSKERNWSIFHLNVSLITFHKKQNIKTTISEPFRTTLCFLLVFIKYNIRLLYLCILKYHRHRCRICFCEIVGNWQQLPTNILSDDNCWRTTKNKDVFVRQLLFSCFNMINPPGYNYCCYY